LFCRFPHPLLSLPFFLPEASYFKHVHKKSTLTFSRASSFDSPKLFEASRKKCTIFS
jgi:hypothetical protein